ncbi:LamG-like jellyroll fold domain-containing protein [Pseudoduganella namucuonensis]|uniref:Alginate lyase n=1 Tax=Pseudoduganella namucuonensis TaxID=1035707 RepID=A0A1I7KW32_9BURK|nr:LamG-like jellyroll fold domain-containing protein [Pseudoduganella namucuonensis]SFV01669.1 Alginate lyase [Pseudoduganella namucuonensis]
MTQPNNHVDTSLAFPTSADNAELAQHLSRRSFLYSLGALALTACGGGAGELLSSSATSAPRTAGAPTPFVHPGLLHTAADFTRMAAKYTTSPWSGSWNLLTSNWHAQTTYNPSPQAVVYRGDDGVHAQNYSKMYNDVAAAYDCALRWKISGDTAYADKAVQIMNGWSAVLTAIGGDTNALLAAGIYGYEFANAGEIMRSYSGWAAADQTRFKNMMTGIFYPICTDFLVRHNNTEWTHYWANWDLCAIACIMAIGVLCDDGAKFDEAVNYFKSGGGNGRLFKSVYYLHPGYLGQWQESGRDQGHATLGIALGGAICEMAWNQGVDLYGYDNNRFLAGAEYVAKSNLIQSGTTYYTVPFVPYNNVDNVNHTVFSTTGIGNLRPCWALVYNHYVNRRGLAAPYSKQFTLQMQPEGGSGYYDPNSGGYDQLGYGTLTCGRDPIATGAVPSGLTGYVSGGPVVLSWWGSAYATSYNVKRATVSGGPYTTIQTGITDLLTYTDTTAPTGTCYYVVTAITPSGETAPSNQAAVITGTPLHTYLTFDASSGTTAADSTGLGHTGTLVGGASWVAGKKNNAVSLNGSTGYVSLPANPLLDVGDFTIATWVYWNASSNWQRIFDFGDGTGQYMYLSPRTGSGVARFAITVNGGKGELGINHTAALALGQWVHVAVTLSGKTGTLYINGVSVGSNANMFHAPFRLGNTSQNWLGRSQFSADPYFNGKLDDFRIYRGALSAAAITTLYNS